MVLYCLQIGLRVGSGLSNRILNFYTGRNRNISTMSSVRPLDEPLFHAGGPRGTNCVEMGLKFHVHTRTLEEEQGWNPPPGIPRVGMT